MAAGSAGYSECRGSDFKASVIVLRGLKVGLGHDVKGEGGRMQRWAVWVKVRGMT